MGSVGDEPLYRVWAADKIVYGPVPFTVIWEWIQEGRVLPDTWVLLEEAEVWSRAREVPEFKTALDKAKESARPPGMPDDGTTGLPSAIHAASLRRMKLLAGFDQAQLESFLRYLEIVPVRQFAYVVRAGEHGDAMYLIVEGELHASIMVNGKETTLCTLEVGDFFGEISVLDHGPRSADVIANEKSLLLKISSENFERMTREAPALALPFLAALGRTVVSRMRMLTKKYADSVYFIRLYGAHG